MNGGHDERSERRLHEFAAMLRDAKIPSEQCLRGRGAQANDDFRLQRGDFRVKPWPARLRRKRFAWRFATGRKLCSLWRGHEGRQAIPPVGKVVVQMRSKFFWPQGLDAKASRQECRGSGKR
jgi:hypothetical protein